jgi:hypothetical protein
MSAGSAMVSCTSATASCLWNERHEFEFFRDGERLFNCRPTGWRSRRARQRCAYGQTRPANTAFSRDGSVHSDDDFAAGVTVANICEGGRYVVEAEGAVDVDADVTGEAQVGQWPEVGWPFFHCEHS